MMTVNGPSSLMKAAEFWEGLKLTSFKKLSMEVIVQWNSRYLNEVTNVFALVHMSWSRVFDACINNLLAWYTRV